MKSHRTDGVSLSFGLIFLVIVVWYLVAQRFTLSLPLVGWTVAGGLIVLGATGLAGALRAARTPPPPVPVTAVPAPADQPTDADRAAVAGRLRVALDHGRLDFVEYNERLQQAYAATTLPDLAEADVPEAS